MRVRPLLGAALFVVLVIVTATLAVAGIQWRRDLVANDSQAAASGSPVPAVSAAGTFSVGERPVAVLPDTAQPVAVGFRGAQVLIVGTPMGQNLTNLYGIDPGTGTAQRLASVGVSAGRLAALGVELNGTAWFGVNTSLVRVRTDGSTQQFSLPPATIPLPAGFGGPPSPGGLPAAESGQITSLVAKDGVVLIGRLGYAEITRLDSGSGAFEHVSTNAVGDVASMVLGPGEHVFFTVNHSATTKGLLNDSIGVFNWSSRAVSTMRTPARCLASVSSHVAFAGYGIGLLDATGTPARPTIRSSSYDESTVAVRKDGSSLLRVNSNDHAVAVLNAAGSEVNRVTYAAIMAKDSRNQDVPYSSSFSFSAAAPDDAVWFALWGRPEVYRIAP